MLSRRELESLIVMEAQAIRRSEADIHDRYRQPSQDYSRAVRDGFLAALGELKARVSRLEELLALLETQTPQPAVMAAA